MARGRPRKVKSDKQLSLLDVLHMSEEARDTIRVMLKANFNVKSSWRGLIAVPPSTLLDKVVAGFREETDIPLEIPFFTTLHFVAAHLLHRGVTVDFIGQTVRPDLWTVILADSGAGKTFSTHRIEEMIGEEAKFPEPASAAKFVEDLSIYNRSLWVRDEFAQFLRTIEQQPHLAEMRDYLLRVYDGRRICRRTKKYEIEIEDPALVILGLTVLGTFKDNVSAESMLDGFAQRFSYVLAEFDPDRPPENFPVYDLRGWREKIKYEWDSIWSQPIYDKYVVVESGAEAFRVGFKLLMPPKSELPISFFRRIMFRGIRYSLLYHILLKKLGDTIDAQDMGWAGRVSALHVKDAMWLLREHGMNDLERMLRRAEEIKVQLKTEGKTIAARDIVRGVWGVRNVSEARGILSLLE